MKSLFVAAGALALASFLNVLPASAGTGGPATDQLHGPIAQSGSAHWEWQYHYVGHHPRYQGHWVWVQ
jgi:hypothetical protein